ncbi:MAG: UDP-2,3-diacylglucosamine diphosphatase [Flavobacteriales bacterium]|nr:UDP-2,3-diacylglucosamine diphosphatase [Flavobacteriales bacterium]
MTPGKKIYFASDFHLGVPTWEESRKREDKIIRWLTEIEKDAEEIYLVGDVFDFWFEYKRAIPKGFVRLQGKIASLCDKGIPVKIFIGNHDMWMFDYLPKELGVELFREPIQKSYNGKTFYIGHGDGLGPGDYGYKFIKKIFRNKICQWLFARLHPNFGIGIADYFSRSSRKKTKHEDQYLGDEKEYLVNYIKDLEKKEHYDYYVFGHRHLPIDMTIGKSRYINLGDWIGFFTYAEFDGSEIQFKKFEA